jgi:hypothetical protein
MRPIMSKLLLVIGAAVVGSLILPAVFWIGSFVVPPSQPAAPFEWRWSEEKASLAYSVGQHLPGQSGELIFCRTFFDIRTEDGTRTAYRLERHSQRCVFTRWKDTIFIAEFRPISTGCKVVAVDLLTGNHLWEFYLVGIGPTKHSKYSNSVNIETDGEKVIIYGNESNGRYVEHLDINSGKMLLNKQFEPLR